MVSLGRGKDEQRAMALLCVRSNAGAGCMMVDGYGMALHYITLGNRRTSDTSSSHELVCIKW